jgi:hypothetical protein
MPAFFQTIRALKLPGRIACWLKSRKKRSTRFIQDEPVGVKLAPAQANPSHKLQGSDLGAF